MHIHAYPPLTFGQNKNIGEKKKYLEARNTDFQQPLLALLLSCQNKCEQDRNIQTPSSVKEELPFICPSFCTQAECSYV